MLLHVQLDGIERAAGLEEFEELVRAGIVGPETPVRVEALTGARWVAAGELELFQGLRESPQMVLRRAWNAPRIPWATALLVGLTVRMHLWVTLPFGDPVANALAKWTPAIVEHGESWRILSHALVHADLEHIASNMVFVAYLGTILEGLLGPANLVVLYVVSVATGGALSALFSENPSIGASGADFGLLAAAVVFGWRYDDIIPPRARSRFGWAMLLYLVYMLGTGLLSGRGIDNFAHVGGAVGGALAMALLKPDVVPAWRRRNRGVQIGALAGLAALLVAFARAPIRTIPVEDDGLATVRPADWDGAWAPTGDMGWGSPLDDARMIAATRKGAGPLSLEAEVEAALDAWRDRAPDLQVAARAPLAISGAEGARGERLTLTYAAGGVPHRVDAAVVVRGWYRHLVALDVGAGNRVASLVPEVVDGLALRPLRVEVQAEDAGDSPRGKALRARAAAEAGRLEDARALLAEARAAAPTDAEPAEAALQVATEWRTPDAADLAEQALAAFPEDRRVVAAAIRALVAAGRDERAAEALGAALQAAPGDRRLEALGRELAKGKAGAETP